ncbi:MAG: hypothetical protein JWO51_3644 [Rhodospirillales bacterium]|jgi:hypothetical protein|nr:hypothetical protein [Rhodospirillales bacterium]
MGMIDQSPTADQLAALAALFARAETLLSAYLDSDSGQDDPNFTALSTAAIGLNNAADTIAVMQLDLATAAGARAVATINQAAVTLQGAIETRKAITRDLLLVQGIVAFGAAIAAGDVGSIADCGDDLCTRLTA